MELRVDPNLTTADAVATVEDVSELHNVTPDGPASGEGTTVAVVDTGVDPTHPVFGGVDLRQVDFTGRGDGDEVGHGTGVAGLVAQLAPDAAIVSLRVFGTSGRTDAKPIADAYEWVVDNADTVDVCNVSWGARSNDAALNRLHRRAVDAGVQDVVAAGNTGALGGSPATARGAFSVGATTADGTLTRFSSYNPERDNPDVAALGTNLELARATGTSMGQVIDDEWVKASGTSFAAPITTGLVARYLTSHDGDVPARFQASARDVPGTPEDGEGIVDYARTVGASRRSSDGPDAGALAYEIAGRNLVVLESPFLETGRYEAVELEDDTVRFGQSSD